MAFKPHNISDAAWGSYIQIPITDTQYPAITARVTDTPEFDGTAVVSDHVYYRYAIIVEDYKNFSAVNTTNSQSVTTSSALLLAANADRKGFKVVNTGGNTVYLLEGAGTASSSNQTVTIAATSGYYESKNPVWTGAVNVVSSSGTNTVVVTEYT